VESLAVILSILLAFSIDAWWDSRVEASRVRAELETLHAEFAANQQDLTALRRRLERLRVAVASLLPHISPKAELIPLDSMNTMMDLSFRLGTIELHTGSVQALLASGELAVIADPELKGLLAAWPAEVSVLRTQSGRLEQNREDILNYLHARIPTLDITHKTGAMGRYPRSDFTVSSAAVQRDMRLEGLFGNRGMMVEDTDDIVVGLGERAARMAALVERLLAER